MNIRLFDLDFFSLSSSPKSLVGKNIIIYCDFNVINYIYENKLVIPNHILAYPDSTAVYIYLKYFLRNGNHKYVSTDIQENILTLADKHAQKVFFFGDSDEVLNYLQQSVHTKYPHIQIVGIHSGYEFKTEQVLNQINELEPDILFVGLGVGRQEKWIIENNERINAKLTISVGGWFQYLSGQKRRAPIFLRKIHLEWLLKLITEFRRVWKRYFIGILLFYYRVITNKICLVFEDNK